MSKTSSMHIRVEPVIKEEVEKILNKLGLNIAEAVNIYLRQIILNSGIPFEIKTPQFSNELLEAIAEAEEIKKHPENYKTFHSVAELMEDLENEENI